MTNIIVFGIIGLVIVFAIFSIINGNKPKGKQEAQKKELFRKLYKIFMTFLVISLKRGRTRSPLLFSVQYCL